MQKSKKTLMMMMMMMMMMEARFDLLMSSNRTKANACHTRHPTPTKDE
jgi:hypothetical protein